MARRVSSLRRTNLVGIGGRADVPRASRAYQGDTNDPIADKGRIEIPQRSSLLHIVCRHGRGRHSAPLDSEQFSSAPRTSRPLCGRLRLR
jgi:hypothetical protein